MIRWWQKKNQIHANITDGTLPPYSTRAIISSQELLPGAKQLLTASGGNPHVGAAHRSPRNERSSEAAGEGEDSDDGVGADIGKPDAIANFRHVRRNSLMEMGARFGGHRARLGHSGPVSSI